MKQAGAIIEHQAIGIAYIPTHKFKENFLEYYEEYVKIINEKITATSGAFKDFKWMNVL